MLWAKKHGILREEHGIYGARDKRSSKNQKLECWKILGEHGYSCPEQTRGCQARERTANDILIEGYARGEQRGRSKHLQAVLEAGIVRCREHLDGGVDLIIELAMREAEQLRFIGR